MKTANVFVNGVYAGNLEELLKGKEYRFAYLANYCGDGVSLTMPTSQSTYVFYQFPPFFDGLLPEGPMLQALLKKRKIDADDRFEQLMQVGKEVVGNVSVERAV
jgi:serine/threonine-protein kinase HipA